ncbi:Inner membrane protein YihY, formerly thought to be RNase BN [Labilithrix luteola]|uniref:Inner membrane protein YihY, formerly thought to be RNase BN n=1 Tax=Labilithrix luteola TaxID=1391654 RepID=A0A0K1QEI2_9BACT|nr:YihY/virulence factor BrkB family protein [Labilithrix luteola]AKV03825.1 Inner membrane protein YihY, formerly thought to be RNase BN [Labilithrix luteola]
MTNPSSQPSSFLVTPVLHPRGRIAPPLPTDAPRCQRVLRTVIRLGQGLVFHDAFDAAPAMAFHFFLSLLPALVFAGYVVGRFAQHDGAAVVLGPLLRNVPGSAASIIHHELERLGDAGGLAPISAVSFFWLASGGTHGLINALETVIGAPRRPWWKKRLLGLAWVVVALVVIAVASWGVVQWDVLVYAPETGKLLRAASSRALALWGSLALAVAVLAVFYRFSVTHPGGIQRRVLPGAVLAVLLWLVISWGFGLYVSTLAGYAVFYGSLAAVAVLLVWLWLTSLAILVGAELNAQLEGLRD